MSGLIIPEFHKQNYKSDDFRLLLVCLFTM